MDLQELQRMMDTVQIGGIFLENTAFSYLEAFSGNALYYSREDDSYEQV